jgi:hypothetical protein
MKERVAFKEKPKIRVRFHVFTCGIYISQNRAALYLEPIAIEFRRSD